MADIVDLEMQNREFFNDLIRQKEHELTDGIALGHAIGNYYEALRGNARTISEIVPAHPAKFRGSSLPFCGMFYLLETLRTEPRLELVTYASEFYTKSGDIFHANLQKWLGSAGIAYGKWVCSNPKCQRRFPDTDDPSAGVLGPVKCCGHFANYQEFEFKHSSGFSGHMDMLCYIHDAYLVTELKQMGGTIYNTRVKNGPDEHHVCQVQSYRAVVSEALKISERKIHEKVLLWYFDRGNLKENHRWILDYNPNLFEREVQKYESALAAIHKHNYGAICMRCKTERDGVFCPYANLICFNKDLNYRRRLLKLLLPEDVAACLA